MEDSSGPGKRQGIYYHMAGTQHLVSHHTAAGECGDAAVLEGTARDIGHHYKEAGNSSPVDVKSSRDVSEPELKPYCHGVSWWL